MTDLYVNVLYRFEPLRADHIQTKTRDFLDFASGSKAYFSSQLNYLGLRLVVNCFTDGLVDWYLLSASFSS